jgi:DNA (cytosine-5)-methyltransferase 1|tara:strand:- start:1188 stop:2069 length:882 start_codon:yes stop_codon:yes gene_type:complete
MHTCLRVGTDCSGIEAPIQALRQLKIVHSHVFSSDIDPYVIQSIKANYDPRIIYGDITKRDAIRVPDIDLYVAGFPCQPFSMAGDRGGFADKRGNVFWSCLDVIKTKQPTYFILENVKALLWHDKGNTWKTIWDSLQLKNYTVKWKVLNTRDYGIPQNRERIFIVGKKNGDFEWPEPTEMDDIRDYIDHTDTKRKEWGRKSSLKRVSPDAVFVDVDFLHYTNYPMAHKVSPCVLARPSSLWCIPYHRYATCKEMFNLQGFDSFKQVVSNSQMKKQIGNSMSVNVLVAILNELL